MVTSSHVENKAAGAWVQAPPACGLCLSAAEQVSSSRILTVTVGLRDHISGAGQHLSETSPAPLMCRGTQRS